MKKKKIKLLIPSVCALTTLGSLCFVACNHEEDTDTWTISGGVTTIDALANYEHIDTHQWIVKKNGEKQVCYFSLIPVGETLLLDSIKINGNGIISWGKLAEDKIYNFQVKAITIDKTIYSPTITLRVGKALSLTGGTTFIVGPCLQEGSDDEQHIWQLFYGTEVITSQMYLEDLDGNPIENIFITNGVISWNSLDQNEYVFNIVASLADDTSVFLKQEIHLFVYEQAKQTDFLWNDPDTVNNTITIDKYIGGQTQSCISIPSTYTNGINTYTVVGIDDYCFSNNNNLSYIKVPDSVLTIKQYCFVGMTTIKYVDLGNGITTIPNSCFYNCGILDTIIMPSNLKEIGAQAFRGCLALKNINFPETLEKVKELAFYECISLTSVVFQKSAQIDKSCFYNCSSLKFVSLADGTTLDESCFYGTSALEKIILPSDLEIIPKRAFCDSSIKDITLPNTLTTIGESAFTNSQLTKITIPSSVNNIGDSAFRNSSLKEIEFNSEIQLKTLPQYCFYNNDNLTSIVLPPSIETIGNSCFETCGLLRHVYIPVSCTSIDSYAFQWDTSLTIIEYGGTADQWKQTEKGFNWEYNVPDECIIKCKDQDLPIRE